MHLLSKKNSLGLLLLLCVSAGSLSSAEDPFGKSNLVAWCIAAFDGKKRSPEERAEMVAGIGLAKVAYDWRQEHVPEFEREILAYREHGIEFFAFWGVHDEALALFEKHGIAPQLWVMLKPQGETQEERIASSAKAVLPVLEQARRLGSEVGLYNHGGWGGEPENLVAVCEHLQAEHGIEHVGIVYNLHHGHDHLERLPAALEMMKPWLLCLNLNGMDVAGDTKGRKILPLGAGTEDLRVLLQIHDSGYRGPVGILNHTQEDAEGRLLDNLDGLNWLLPQLRGNKPGPKPDYRTWSEPEPAPEVRAAAGVPSINEAFGQALSGGLRVLGNPAYHNLPFTIECRARFDSKARGNILVACNPRSADTHWALHTHTESGTLALHLPGRGGDYDTQVDICDGAWRDLLASVSEESVRIWIDGELVLEEPTGKPEGLVRHAGVESLAFGRFVEGTLGCDGLVDDVRLSRGVMEPQPNDAPRQRLESTLGLWDFDDLAVE